MALHVYQAPVLCWVQCEGAIGLSGRDPDRCAPYYHEMYIPQEKDIQQVDQQTHIVMDALKMLNNRVVGFLKLKCLA